MKSFFHTIQPRQWLIVIFAVVVLAGVAVTTGLVAATGDDVRFTSWQAAFDHLAGRVANVENKVSNLESKHSIVCTTLLAEYDAGYDLFSSDTEQQSHTQGLREVEDYLDLATSGTHYQTYWTRAGAEAEYNRCKEEEEEASPATTPTPEPTAVTGTPAPQTTVTPQPVSEITTGYGDWWAYQHDCPSDWDDCEDSETSEYVALFAETHNSTFVPEGSTFVLPHSMQIECFPTAGTGLNRAWAEFTAWGYDIYDATPSITVTADGGTAQTYTGRKNYIDSNEGLYFSISDTQSIYRQIENATEVVITSTVDAEGTTARAEFTVTGIANAVNTLSCWSASSALLASPSGLESIRTDAKLGTRMDALNATESVVSR